MYSNRNGQKNTVAHNWANEVESNYKKDTVAGSLYYEGLTIYSYGRHFPIAVIHKDKKRGNVTFFTTRGYSNTTAKHISAVRGACSHHTLIFCANPDEADRGHHIKNLEAWNDAAKNIARNLARARKPEKYLLEIARERAEAQVYAKYFGIKLSAKKYPFLFIETKDGGNKASERELKELEAARKRQEEARKRREENERKEFEKALQRFRSFTNEKGEATENIYLPYNYMNQNAAYLRYNERTKRIETSKSVEIPVEAARRFYKWLQQTAKNGGCDGSCTQKILNYSVQYVNGNEFKIGCHTIQMSEADNIAKALNW